MAVTGPLEDRYRAGVERWGQRDLIGAVEMLTAAVADGSLDDQWWHSASRALAQIALERDDPESERHLRRLQGTGVGDAQTIALRARRCYQAADEEHAILEIHVAAMRLTQDASSDVGSLMNGAMALIWCAETLAELGLADDASALMTRARARMASAGVDDTVLSSMLAMVEASTARLAVGEAAVMEALGRVDTTLSPDLEAKAIRERARVARDAGRHDEAAELYEQCRSLARAAKYDFLERSIAHEAATEPPSLRTDRAPIGQWDPRAMENVPEDHVPYALVIRVPLRNRSEILDFEEKVSSLLQIRPGLGHVDGTGSDGEIWELFLDGDDADWLWDEVRPILESSPLGQYAEISKRSGTESRHFRLSPPRP